MSSIRILDPTTLTALEDTGFAYRAEDVKSSTQLGFAVARGYPPARAQQDIAILYPVDRRERGRSFGGDIPRPYALIGTSSVIHLFDPNVGEFKVTVETGVRALFEGSNSTEYRTTDFNASYIPWSFNRPSPRGGPRGFSHRHARRIMCDDADIVHESFTIIPGLSAMSLHVCNGATLQCSFGLAPGTLIVLPENQCITGNMPAATIMDNKPMVNVMPFGMCNSLANPTVASATAAALGALTPMPCVPVIPAPWVPGAPTVLLGNFPVLNDTSKLMCAYGGVIQIVVPGQFTEMVP